MIEHAVLANIKSCITQVAEAHAHEFDPECYLTMITLSSDLSVYVGPKRSRLVRTHCDGTVEILKTWTHGKDKNQKG